MPAANEFRFPSSNGKDTVRAWSTRPKNTKAVLLLAHGMCEYSDRYLPFASFMCEHGVAVYANDHLGHGRSFSGEPNRGCFAEKHGWRALVDDMEKLRKIAAGENPGLPVFYLGHSMGSFLLRTYLFTYPGELDGAILSGTIYKSKLLSVLGGLLSKIEKAMFGSHYRSKLIDLFVFGPFRIPFRPRKTRFDWLSRDEDNVRKYCADDLCGFIFTLSAYIDLFDGLSKIVTPGNIKRGNPNLPVLFVSGSRDPVGGMTKGVDKVAGMFKKAGYTNVAKKFYSDARHEILNDFCAEAVRKDILDWLFPAAKNSVRAAANA